MKIKIPDSDVFLECVKGDITFQSDIDVIVNAANASLVIGGGVAGAIHSSAGPELEKESEKLGPIKPGEAVITSAYNLPNKHVIHCLGPVYGRDKPEDKLLSDCYKNALDIAEENKLNSISFPAISTGAFGYPVKKASRVSIKTIKEKSSELKNLKLIRFVLFSERDLEEYKNAIKELFNFGS